MYTQKEEKHITMQKKLYRNVHSSAIHFRPKVEATQMTTNEWVNEISYIHTMLHYSTVKRNEAMKYTEAQVNFKILS